VRPGRPVRLEGAHRGLVTARLRGGDDGPAAAPRVAGCHRFARYGITFRIEAAPAGTRLAAESRAEFAGALGALYGLMAVGSAGHAIAVRRLLRNVRRLAEQQGTDG